jgi:hypothetical protein
MTSITPSPLLDNPDPLITERDYTLMIDKSASMNISDDDQGKTRWELAHDSTLELAKVCEKFDPDGITIYLFSGRYRRYDNVTSDKVTEIYAENEPMGATDLSSVLEDALENYFARKAKGETKPNGETFLIITDGAPDDPKSVMKLILNAADRIDGDEEMGISFIQVGHDREATKFFQALDDRLQDIGARYDIVDTITIEDMQDVPLTQVLLNAIID